MFLPPYIYAKILTPKSRCQDPQVMLGLCRVCRRPQRLRPCLDNSARNAYQKVKISCARRPG